MISRNESSNNYINLSKISVNSQSISNQSINIIIWQLWGRLSNTAFIQSNVVSAIILIIFVSISFLLWSFDSWSIFSFSRCSFSVLLHFKRSLWFWKVLMIETNDCWLLKQWSSVRKLIIMWIWSSSNQMNLSNWLFRRFFQY